MEDIPFQEGPMDASSSTQPHLHLDVAGPSVLQRLSSSDTTWSHPSLDLDDPVPTGDSVRTRSLCIPPMSFGYSVTFPESPKNPHSDTDV